MPPAASAAWRSRPTTAAARCWRTCWTPRPSPETQKLLAEIRGPSGSRDAGASARRCLRRRCRPRRRHPSSRTSTRNPRPVLEPRTQELAMPRGGAHVGVLPLQFVGTSEEEPHLAPGLAEEITTALSRFRWMFVVASSSLARFAAETPRRERRSGAPSASTSCSTARSSGCATGCASPCDCSICAPATRWSGRAASTARPMTC